MSSLHDWRPDLTIAPSITLSVWVAALHLIFLALLPFLGLHPIVVAALVLGVILNWAFLHRRYLILRDKSAVKHIRWCDDGWMLTTNSGLQGPFALAGGSRIAKGIIWLQFKSPRAKFRVNYIVPILRDSLDEDSYRKLQVFLRWQKKAVVNPALHPQS